MGTHERHFQGLKTRFVNHRLVKAQLLDRYRRVAIRRDIQPLPTDALVPLEEAEDVLLVCSAAMERFHLQTYVQELAYAHELAEHGRSFAVTDQPRDVFGKRLAWFLPGSFVRPRLWDYARQAYEFAQGLERQGNDVFCSAEETRFWENKAHMHRRFDEIGIATPETVIVTAENRGNAELPREPLLVKQEHSAGSAGIHFFATSTEARAFIGAYPFRPTESLIVQEIVRGATRDMRLTMAGRRVVADATYWRQKSAEALAGPTWTPTATKYGSTVEHVRVPDEVAAGVAGYLEALGIRTAGVDLIWPDDDTSSAPLVLELSPYYQPNPPKPDRYADWSYRSYKQRSYVRDGYLLGQYGVFRRIAADLLDQELV
jgi:glutathione synthase/RimK-type ligase-like ATP-grasp enzyme